MKILFVTDQIYLHGGLERVISNKVSALLNYPEIDIHICTVNQKDNNVVYNLDHKNITLHDLGVNYNRDISYFSKENLSKIPGHLIKINKTITKLKPDVIIVCNYTPDFYILPLIKKKALLIKEFHSSRYEYFSSRKLSKGFLKKIYDKLSDLFVANYDHIIVLNDDEKKFFNCSNVEIIPNFIIERTSEKAELLNKRAIAAGRLAPVKRFDELINIWSELIVDRPDWELHIYGDGEKEYIEYLKELILDKNLSNHVFLMGSTNILKDKMLQSSLYLMTSRTECFPMVLLESMEVGLPIISYDCPTGPKNIISNNVDGILVQNNNLNSFKKALILLIDNYKIRTNIAKQAQETVKKYYSENIINIWIKLYRTNNNGK